ncbi:Mur ligase family protein [Crocinitomix sp.]|nr:Mur ligase family protein [Crocinitomix sp.]
MRVHFIAIGGSAMHNLALALKRKGDFVTGSDDEIFEPSKSRLKENGILPKSIGWQPEMISNKIDVIILGMHARVDNPELLRAQELGLKIYSYPEFVYGQTEDKVRLVVGGSHGKTTITSMLLHVMDKLEIETDFLVGALLEGFDCMVQLSDAKYIVIEGDEYLSSPIDRRPKFHWYAPHIALISGIAWDHINVFPTFENYVEQFQIFTDKIEGEGSLIYFDQDESIQSLLPKVRKDVKVVGYNTPEYNVVNGVTHLTVDGKDVPLKIFGNHNLQNLLGAKLMLNEIGVSDEDFYTAIQSFKGAAKRLELIAEGKSANGYKDFAHSPSKLKATVAAVKNQFPNRKLIACMELHTFSSLKKDFLPQYDQCMKEADEAFVYYSPEVVAHKKLEPINDALVAKSFGTNNVTIFTDSDALAARLRSMNWENANLLLMSSGNFHGIDLNAFAKELIEG